MFPNEPEILDARLPFSDAQAALDGVAESTLVGTRTCEWYGNRISSERGSFCLINADGSLTDLIGDRLRLSAAGRSVVVYAVASFDLGVEGPDLAITRRSFAALELLAVERIDVTVEVLTG